ncbi:TonB-dependent receptor [Pontibacter sp. G13]|uniref:SusC/RagA family TonB-linked outer membrane protein n=1 Tax=Pontibacter sp. G13 TaxID=3074898 RepID=UPI00288AFB03|nr:TonB-dependent receptor [Pontibacter sp. G13]WNJ20643.1 TonB-dependent receptor [Pontibacter sp. G13]
MKLPTIATRILRHRVLYLWGLIFLSFTAQAQIQVTGRVTSEGGQPLPGVTILEKGDNINGALSDDDGTYRITVQENSVLLFRYFGFREESISVNGRTTIDLEMEEDIEQLDEIVVIGYGTERKSDLTGSVTSVKGDEIMKSTGTALENALQGRLAGVKVTTTDGEPGGGFSVNVRGIGTINGNSEPLYVLDGVPLQKDNLVGETDNSLVGEITSDPLAGLNPNDIESIEVLKDASATAIYGSRGANGVVLITTKSGQEGALQMSYTGSIGTSWRTRPTDLIDSEGFYRYRYALDSNDGLFKDSTLRYYVHPDSIPFVEGGTNWEDEVTRDAASIMRHQINFRGGANKTTFFASLGYFDQEGVIVNSDFQRYSGQVNLNSNMGKLKMSTRLNFSRSEKSGAIASGGGPNNDYTGVIWKAYNTWPAIGPDDVLLDDEFLEDEIGLESNPLLFATTSTRNQQNTRMTGNINLRYEILDGLEVTMRLGGTSVKNIEDVYYPRYTTRAGFRLNGIANIIHTDVSNYLVENLIRYRTRINKHNIQAVVGHTFEQNQRRVLRVRNQGFEFDNLGVYDIGAGTELITPQINLTDFALDSYLGRINYNFARKYLVTLNARLDGSSKFPAGSKYAFFPSAAFAWKIDREKFLRKSNVFSELKLRYSIGATGNQGIPPYSSIGLLNTVTYSYGGELVSGVAFSQLANTNLRWETTVQQDLGLDMGLFNDRLVFTVDAYHKRASDVLLAVPVSGVVGVNNNPRQNVGVIINRGLEISARTVNVSTDDFSWSTNFNISFIRNELADLGALGAFNVGIGSGQFGDMVRYETGEEIGNFYGLQTDGIIRSEEELANAPFYEGISVGNWNFVDQNGDSLINQEDRVIIGNSQSDFFGGITNRFSYKGIDLSIFFEYAVGHDIYNTNRTRLQRYDEPGGTRTNDMLERTFFPEDVVTPNGTVIFPANPDGDLPMIGRQDRNVTYDEFVEDGSYIRLQNITLTYTLPFAKAMRVSDIKLGVNANNIFVWTNYSGFDPDVNIARANGLVRGVDWSPYPRNRNIMGTIQVNF